MELLARFCRGRKLIVIIGFAVGGCVFCSGVSSPCKIFSSCGTPSFLTELDSNSSTSSSLPCCYTCEKLVSRSNIQCSALCFSSFHSFFAQFCQVTIQHACISLWSILQLVTLTFSFRKLTIYATLRYRYSFEKPMEHWCASIKQKCLYFQLHPNPSPYFYQKPASLMQSSYGDKLQSNGVSMFVASRRKPLDVTKNNGTSLAFSII